MNKLTLPLVLIVSLVVLSGCSDNKLNYQPQSITGNGKLVDDLADNSLGGGDICTADTGSSITVDEAYEIAQNSPCVHEGAVKKDCNCNRGTGTCWLTMEGVDKPGCAPACVVNVETKEAEVNWRCTGLITE